MSLTKNIAAILNQMPVIALFEPQKDWEGLIIHNGRIEDVTLKNVLAEEEEVQSGTQKNQLLK